jgi:mono/diheme cytochrome c family protein
MRLAPLRLSLAACVTLATLVACRSSSTSQSPTPAGGGAAARPALPAAVTPSNIAMGDSIFNNGSCQNCHGKGGVGGANAPALDGKAWVQLKTGSFDEIVALIVSGVPADKIKDKSRTRAMGARGGRMALTDPQIQAVAAYVYTISHK